ncbi:DmsC/YnfH family molybdoenzyme membrane anchor subunit [Bacillaceae bacterium S4-13-56]
MNEWALLIYTICVQAAVGGVFMLWVYYWKLSKMEESKTFLLYKVPLLVVSGLSLVGLVASFAHLGTPLNALNTLRHLGSSWMSREILLTGIFIALVCITTGLVFVQKKVNPHFLLVTFLVGLGTVFTMSAIYANTFVNGWNSINTYTSFYGTALVLGPVLGASMIVPMLRKENQELTQGLIKQSFYVAILGVAVQLVGLAVFSTGTFDINMINGATAAEALDGFQGTVALRWIVEVAGLALLGYVALASMKQKVSFSLVHVVLAVLVVAEGISRYVFYTIGS